MTGNKGERNIGGRGRLPDCGAGRLGSPSPRERVAHALLLLRKPNVEGLQIATGLPEDTILRETEALEQQFGVTGDRKGFMKSKDPQQVSEMAAWVKGKRAKRVLRK